MSESNEKKESTVSKQAKSESARSLLLPANSRVPLHRPLASAIALALSLSMASAQAATIIVDTASDTETGMCRLRDAIIAANTDAPVEGCTAGSGADLIRLIGIAGQTITLNGSPLPAVTSEVSIQGESVTIDGNGGSRLMQVDGASLGISYLSLIGGLASGTVAPANSGGAIRVSNNASLELVSSTVSGNTAVGGGGGISLENATLTLVNSTLSDNSAGSNGGGIELGSLSTATLMNSTLSGNSASAKGGGIYVGGPYGGYGTSLFLTNSTLSGNSAGGSAPAGGGIFVVYGQALQLTNSVIANSTGGDCSISVAATGYGVNLIVDGSCLTAGPGLLTGDPLLGPLASNGGPTMTHAVPSESPVIDAFVGPCFVGVTGVIPANSPSLLGDQRGYQRTDGQCDLGAYEYAGAAGQTGPDFEVNTSADPSLRFDEIIKDPPNPDIRIPRRVDNGDGICSLPPGDCTLREAVAASNRSDDASVISFAAALTAPPVTVRLAGTQLPTVTSDITIQGEGVLVNARQNEIENFRSRIFEIDGASLSIDRLDLTRGNGTTGGADPQGKTGGAILVRNGGNLAISNSTLSYNDTAYSGAAIYAGADSLVSLSGATLTNNFTVSDGDPVCASNYACGGGAITVVNGTTNLTNSSLNLNTTSGVYGPGGAMHMEGGELSITSSTLSGNSTLVFGGGVWMEGTSFTVINSTFSGNRGNSGALFAGTGSTGQLIQSTISGSPEEIAVQFSNATVTLTNSILADALFVNCRSSGSVITTTGVNLIEQDGEQCGLTPGATLLSGDPMLGPLADNGGPTQTHLPQPGSPVINAGDNAALNAAVPGGLLYDQRGAGYPRFFEINVDLGSVEWTPYIFRDGFEDPGP